MIFNLVRILRTNAATFLRTKTLFVIIRIATTDKI